MLWRINPYWVSVAYISFQDSGNLGHLNLPGHLKWLNNTRPSSCCDSGLCVRSESNWDWPFWHVDQVHIAHCICHHSSVYTYTYVFLSKCVPPLYFQVDIIMGMDSGDLSDFVENVEWECRGMPATKNVIMYGCCSDPYPDITYTVLLQRRSSFYIFNLLLPCFLISFLAPLGFYLPADSGEKVSLGVTVLLALTVFQLMVAESMPPSESVPLIGKKVLVFFRNIFNNLFLLHGLCFCHSIIKKNIPEIVQACMVQKWPMI